MNINDLAHDVATTSGETVRMILANSEAMACLDRLVASVEDGLTLGDFVRCAQTELDAYDQAFKALPSKYGL